MKVSGELGRKKQRYYRQESAKAHLEYIQNLLTTMRREGRKKRNCAVEMLDFLAQWQNYPPQRITCFD